jgi:hypothetical protein
MGEPATACSSSAAVGIADAYAIAGFPQRRKIALSRGATTLAFGGGSLDLGVGRLMGKWPDEGFSWRSQLWTNYQGCALQNVGFLADPRGKT